uniref:Uncharacterized protein n=1 Tax=Solanum tuberosum TaxID=4113 RepID=M1A3W4_SOLTU
MNRRDDYIGEIRVDFGGNRVEIWGQFLIQKFKFLHQFGQTSFPWGFDSFQKGKGGRSACLLLVQIGKGREEDDTAIGPRDSGLSRYWTALLRVDFLSC